MNALLLARRLSHGPAARRRLNDIDLQLDDGERLGLLGVNGAGKSTLLQLLAGVQAPDHGEVLVRGERFSGSAGTALRGLIGYLPQRPPLYPELSLRENLEWAGRLHGLRGKALQQAIARVSQQLELDSLGERLAGRLSGGTAQRAGLAQALLHRPQILLLDEPTAGLDPLQTEQLRILLATLTADTSLIIATHLLDDVQQLCSRVVLLDGGHQTAEHTVTPQLDLLGCLRAQAAPAEPAA